MSGSLFLLQLSRRINQFKWRRASSRPWSSQSGVEKKRRKKKKKLAGKCCRCRQFRFHFRIDFPITHKSGLGYINTYHKRGNGGGSFGKFCCALSPPDFNIWKETKFSSVFCLFLTVDREGNGWWFSCCRHIVCDALVLSLVAGQHVPNNQITRLFNVNPIFFVWHMTN